MDSERLIIKKVCEHLNMTVDVWTDSIKTHAAVEDRRKAMKDLIMLVKQHFNTTPIEKPKEVFVKAYMNFIA